LKKPREKTTRTHRRNKQEKKAEQDGKPTADKRAVTRRKRLLQRVLVGRGWGSLLTQTATSNEVTNPAALKRGGFAETLRKGIPSS